MSHKGPQLSVIRETERERYERNRRNGRNGRRERGRMLDVATQVSVAPNFDSYMRCTIAE